MGLSLDVHSNYQESFENYRTRPAVEVPIELACGKAKLLSRNVPDDYALCRVVTFC